jgi:hypothetical protein
VAVRVFTSVSAWERDRRLQMTSAARAKVVIPLSIQPQLKRRIARVQCPHDAPAIANELNEERVPTVPGGTSGDRRASRPASATTAGRLAPLAAQGPMNGRRQ